MKHLISLLYGAAVLAAIAAVIALVSLMSVYWGSVTTIATYVLLLVSLSYLIGIAWKYIWRQ